MDAMPNFWSHLHRSAWPRTTRRWRRASRHRGRPAGGQSRPGPRVTLFSPERIAGAVEPALTCPDDSAFEGVAAVLAAMAREGRHTAQMHLASMPPQGPCIGSLAPAPPTSDRTGEAYTTRSGKSASTTVYLSTPAALHLSSFH